MQTPLVDRVMSEYKSGEMYKRHKELGGPKNDNERYRLSYLILYCYSYEHEADTAEKEKLIVLIKNLHGIFPSSISNIDFKKA